MARLYGHRSRIWLIFGDGLAGFGVGLGDGEVGFVRGFSEMAAEK